MSPASKSIAPYTAADAKGLLKSRDPRSQSGRSSSKTKSSTATPSPVPKLDDYLVPIGKARDRARRQAT